MRERQRQRQRQRERHRERERERERESERERERERRTGRRGGSIIEMEKKNKSFFFHSGYVHIQKLRAAR